MKSPSPNFKLGENKMAKTRNQQVAAARLGAKPVVAHDQLPKAEKITRDERFEHAPTIAETIAKHPNYCRNWRIPNYENHFPDQPNLWTVEKYFQFAAGGPLYVDEPLDAEEIKECEKKAVVLEKYGLRYLVIKPGMDIIHAVKALEKAA